MASLRRLAAALAALFLHAASAANLRAVGGPKENQDTAYLASTLTRFRQFADDSRRQLAEQHATVKAKLVANAESAQSDAVRLALQQSVTNDEENMLEMQGLYGEVANFSEAMLPLLEQMGRRGPSCDHIACGRHATCTTTPTGAECICNPGFVGLGHNCHAPYEFMPHPLVIGSHSIRVADVSVCVFDGSRFAVVFRDVHGGGKTANSGQIVVGRVQESGLAELAPPEQFTAEGATAFQPVVAGIGGSQLAIVWRDRPQHGACLMRAAVLGGTGIRGADTAITWGAETSFCDKQAHKMAVVPLPEGRFAVLFAGSAAAPADSFGAALLAASRGGRIAVLGQFRFAESPVCRLEVTQLSATSFAVAARSLPMTDEIDPTKVTNQEAMVVFGELVGNDLAFDPNVINLEPVGGPVWSRGVSRIANNTIAYSYQDAKSMKIKVAVVGRDRVTRKMSVLSNSQVVRSGFSSYVAMPPAFGDDSNPHILTLFEDTKSKTSMVNVCTWDAAKRTVAQCQDFPWLDQLVESVGGIPVGNGKFMLAFATEAGVPYYTVFGVAQKGVAFGAAAGSVAP